MKGVLAGLLVALFPAVAAAQELSVGGLVQSYTMSEPADVGIRSLRLAAVPFGAGIFLSPGARVAVAGAYASGSATFANGDEHTIEGLTDTHASIGLSSGNLVFTASALMPTGDVVRGPADATVVGLMSTDLLPFAVVQWGTGGGYAADATYSIFGVGAVVQLSAGAAVSSGSSEVMSDELVYRPGRQMRARVGVESSVGDASLLSFAVGFQHFAVDTYEGRNLFTAGPRIEGAVSYAFPMGSRRSALLFGSINVTREGRAAIRSLPIDFRGFAPGVTHRSPRTLFRTGGELRFAWDGYELIPRAEMRVLRSGEGVGQGWLASFGSRGLVRVGAGGLTVEPEAFLRLGALVAGQSLESRVGGWEVSLTARQSFRP